MAVVLLIVHCVVWHRIHGLLKELAAAKDWSSRFLRKMLIVYQAIRYQNPEKKSIIFIKVYRIKMFLIRLRERYTPLSRVT